MMRRCSPFQRDDDVQGRACHALQRSGFLREDLQVRGPPTLPLPQPVHLWCRLLQQQLSGSKHHPNPAKKIGTHGRTDQAGICILTWNKWKGMQVTWMRRLPLMYMMRGSERQPA